MTIERFLGLSGAEAVSYCGDRKNFFGEYRNLSNPQGIENGDLGDELSYASESIGALSVKITLEPGESSTVCFTAGIKNNEDSTEIIRHYEVHTKETVARELREIKRYWNEIFSPFDVRTPSAEFNRMVNVMNVYACISFGYIDKFEQLIPEIAEMKDGEWSSKILENHIADYLTDRGVQTLKSVKENLNTAYGVVSVDPPYDASHAGDAALMNPGVRENGGIFSKDQALYVFAAALLGDGDDAFMYFDESSPASQNRKADIRQTEPYMYSECTDGKYSPLFGRSQGPWAVSAAKAIETACIEGICGIRPGKDCLYISPSVPSEWTEFSMHLSFKGHELFIKVDNHEHKQSGVKKVTVNGEIIDGCSVTEAQMTDNCDIEVYL